MNNQNAGVAAAHIDPATGLIRSWKGATAADTTKLKQLVESGLIDGFTTAQLKTAYVQYQRFTNKCLGDKVSNLRRSYRQAVERRNTMAAAGGGGQGLPALNAVDDSRAPNGAARARARRAAAPQNFGLVRNDSVSLQPPFTILHAWTATAYAVAAHALLGR